MLMTNQHENDTRDPTVGNLAGNPVRNASLRGRHSLPMWLLPSSIVSVLEVRVTSADLLALRDQMPRGTWR